MNEVVNILPIKVQEGDLVLVEVREDLPEDRRELIQVVLEEHAEDSEVHFLVLPENVVRDFKRLSLPEMISLRELLDEFIHDAISGGVVGEA